MRAYIRTMLAASLALLAGAAWAEVSVSYVKPDDFSDVPRNAIDRERVLKDFSDYFAALNAKLPAGQNLKIEVLDIDMAGRMWPRRHGGEDIRVLNGGADWPRMHLRYTLEQDGKVLRSGDEQLSNMNYMQTLSRYSDSDTLRYEKQMLDDWFNKAIVPKVAKR
ncbi:DUF3016 domain-containing protein [Rugamonas sp. A1-17]|nr:DUF3016 domain-containing protein [Rugamonas sp. A1-17]